MYQGFQRWPTDLSQYTTQKRESKFGEKRAEPNQNTCLQPFLVFIFFAQNEILHTIGRGCHWALFHPLFIHYLSINGFNNFSNICTLILHVSKQCVLSISEWLSNLPNDCDQYIQAFTLTQMQKMKNCALPPFPLWCQLPVCNTHVNVAVWPKLKFFCGFVHYWIFGNRTRRL